MTPLTSVPTPTTQVGTRTEAGRRERLVLTESLLARFARSTVSASAAGSRMRWCC